MRVVMIGDIYGNDAPLYYPNDKEYVIYGTSWNQKVGLCGEFTFNVPRSNPKYQDLEEFKIITILKDGKEEWRGYIKNSGENTDKNSMNVYCLEDLAFLKQSIAPVQQNVDRATKLQSVIASYNAMAGVAGTVKTFEAGYVISGGTGLWKADYNTDMLGALRGLAGDNQYVRVRRAYDNNNVLHRYIDFVTLGSYGINNRQKIEFGENLRDFTKELNTSWMVNVLNPYGNEIEGDEIYEGCTRRISGTTITDATSISKYGRIEKNVTFDTDDTTELQTMAAEYMELNKDPRLTLELTAIDLSQAGYDTDSLNIGDKVKVIAAPCNIDQYVYITELNNFDIQALDKNIITLSSTVPSPRTLTEQQAEISKEIEKKIPDVSSILSAAQANAIALLSGANGGYINTIFDSNNRWTELWITDSIDPSQATDKLVLNKNGLGHMYFEDGTWKVNIAMTIDGSIVAEMIKSGTIDAERIKASVIAAINGQNLKIEAKNIDINGAVTFTDLSAGMQSYIQNKADLTDLNDYATKEGLSQGTTTVNGGCVTTGEIKSNNYSEQSAASDFSTAGTKLDLLNGRIKSKNFRIDNNGGQFGILHIDSGTPEKQYEDANIWAEGWYQVIDEDTYFDLKSGLRLSLYLNPYLAGFAQEQNINYCIDIYEKEGQSHDSDIQVGTATLYKRTSRVGGWTRVSPIQPIENTYQSANFEDKNNEGEPYNIDPEFGKNYGELLRMTFIINFGTYRKTWLDHCYMDIYMDSDKKLRISLDTIVGSFRGDLTGSARLYDLEFGEFKMNSDGAYDKLTAEVTSNGHYAELSGDRLIIANDSDGTSSSYAVDVSRTNVVKHVSGTAMDVTWNTSDKRAKEEIEPLDMDTAIAIIDGSQPKKFKYKNIPGKHYGMLAQDARELLDSLNENDSALEHLMNIQKDAAKIPNQRTIDYHEYIAPMILYLQYLRAKTDGLMDKIKLLEGGHNG